MEQPDKKPGRMGRLGRTAAAAVLVLLACAACSTPGQPAAVSPPKSIVTTFLGEAGTSRAFTWYTEEASGTGVLELAPGDQPAAFTKGTGVRTVAAVSEPVQTDKEHTETSHKAAVTGLEPGHTYIYRVGRPGAWSEPAVFETETPAESDAVTFLNVTDSQGESEEDFTKWSHTLDKAFALFPEARFVLHNGDLTEDPENESGWNDFFRLPQQWITRYPLMPVTGNHEEVSGEAGRFTSHFLLPDNGAKGSLPGTSYSFDYGPVHVAVLNTESNVKGQTDWLRRDLAATDKPWKIVAMHRGIYGGSTYDKSEVWLPVIDEFQVDLVLQGHNHEYSRSYPIRNGKVTSTEMEQYGSRIGTVYTVINTAGTKFNEEKKDLFYHAVHLQNGKQMFAAVVIQGNTLTYQAYDADGSLWDQFVLKH